MPEIIMYRQQLLRAVEFFLEKTPAAVAHAHHIIQHCYRILRGQQGGNITVDELVWGSLVQALTDSEFYENKQFLQDTREMLLGHVSQNFSRTTLTIDYRPYFTIDETEWYTQLVSLFDFVTVIPFASLRVAIQQAKQQKISSEKIYDAIPEAALIEAIDQEYQQRKVHIEGIAEKTPLPENMGNEKIYVLILREITANLVGIRVGKTAISAGYPIPSGSLSQYGDDLSSKPFDMTGSIQWSKRALETLSGKTPLFFSWRLGKLSSPISDALILSIH